MTVPFFSIIIPTYNAAQTLFHCLGSILQQTETDVEIIIQDGGSTDDTMQIAKSFDSDRVRFFSEPDSGIYDAMNKAIERSTGTWLLFLGSDDQLYTIETLASLKLFLDSTAHIDLVYGNVVTAGDSHWIRDGEIYMGKTDLPILFEKNLCQQSILYNKRIFDGGERYDLKYPILADFDLNLRCFARYRVAYTPQIIAIYHTGGLSSTMADTAFASDKWANIIRYYRYKLLSSSMIAYKRNLKRAAKRLLKNGDISDRITGVVIYLYFKFAA